VIYWEVLKKIQLALYLQDFLVSSSRNMLIVFPSQFLRFVTMREVCCEILILYTNIYSICRKIVSFWEKYFHS